MDINSKQNAVPEVNPQDGYFFIQSMNYRQILNERLKLYLQAERDILNGQSVEVEGMRLTRADLDIVRKQINNLRNELDESGRVYLGKPRSRVRTVVPI